MMFPSREPGLPRIDDPATELTPHPVKTYIFIMLP